MGYRSTLTTNDNSCKIPQWFKDKWQEYLHCERMPISTKGEYKTYGVLAGLEADLLKVIKENEHDWSDIHLVVMGEDGALYYSEITKEGIFPCAVTRAPAPSDYIIT